MRLKGEAGVYRGADVRSAKPRGAAPECRADPAFRRLQAGPTRHRATSHNGARYASVRSKTPSHVALSGAPPRCLQAEKSGSCRRHTFRPSGNPAGWNRKRSVPLALLLVNPGVMGGASVAATLRGPKGVLPLVVLNRGTPRSPVPLCRNFKPASIRLQVPSFTPSPE